MTDDDKQHEYVPQIAPGVLDARLQLREMKSDLRQAQHDHTELLIERNNLAEALRQVNARLVEITDERDGYRNRWQMLERDIEPLRALANRVPILEENVARLAEQLAAAKITITSLTSERDALAVNFAAAVKSLEIYSGAREDDRR